MMKSDSFDLKYQNFFIKSFVIFVSMVVVNYNPNMIILFAGSFIYFFPFTKYIKYWVKSTFFLLPFFISYLGFGILFNIDFIEQICYIEKIIFLVLMSVYFVKSLDINRILTDLGEFLKFDFVRKIITYLIALLEIIPLFHESFSIKKKQINMKNMEIIFRIFFDTFSEVFSKLDEIEIIVLEKMESFRESKSSLTMNFYSMIMFITLYFSIKY
jgi:hypothetical protein